MGIYDKAKEILFEKDLLAFIKTDDREKCCKKSKDNKEPLYRGAWKEDSSTTWGYFVKAEDTGGSPEVKVKKPSGIEVIQRSPETKLPEKSLAETKLPEKSLSKESNKIKVFFVEDNKSVSLALRTLITNYKEMKLLGSAANGKEAVEKITGFKEFPDVILMDVAMPRMNGIEAAKEILKLNSSQKIIMLTAYGTKEYIVDAFAAGAIGFLRKDGGLGIIRDAICQAAGGGVVPMQDEVAAHLLSGIGEKPSEEESDDEILLLDEEVEEEEITEEEFIEDLLSELMEQILSVDVSDYQDYLNELLNRDVTERIAQKFLLQFEEDILPEGLTEKEVIKKLGEGLYIALEKERKKLKKFEQ